MKRKIAILLAAVMTSAMLPMNVLASSSNSITKRVTVKNEDPIGSDWTVDGLEVATSGDSYKPVYLKILPQTGVDRNSSILINIENGEFDEEKFPMPVYTSGAGNSYEDMMDLLESGMSLTQVLNSNLGTASLELPYRIVNVSKREIEVELFPIDEKDCDKSSNSVAYEKPYYYIPIHALADGTGDVTITIDDNETNISGGGTYTIATSSDDDGSTTTTVDDLTTFRDAAYMETITIKENVKETFKPGETVRVRLSGGFRFVEDDATEVTLSGSAKSITLAHSFGKDNEELTFVIPEETNADFKAMRSATARIRIENLRVEAQNDDDDWGDVSVTISGADVTKETIQIGTRADYGFNLTAVDSPTTIVAGRTYYANEQELEEDDFETAAIKFEETNEGSWLTSRKMKFTVPEGVKIVDYDFDNVKYVSRGDLEEAAQIDNEGTTLTLLNKDMDIDEGECAEFELTLYVSVDADFAGDITVGVSGAGIEDESVLEDVVVANAITPITITSSTTSSNMGYQAVDTADITITEAQAGVLLDDQEVVVELDSLYGEQEVGFADDDTIDYTIEGELEIKNFDVSEGAITFDIDKDSYNEPSSITLNNVRVGSTRSVPYGSYDLKVSGGAVINNYDKNIDDVYPIKGVSFLTGSEDDYLDDMVYFDTTDGYSFDDYLSIVTETGTLDSVVEVTIGESTIKVDGEDVTMDVAPYIQTSSNSTMVPLRFVSIAIGVDSDNVNSVDDSSKVMWDANSKTATILYAAGNGQKIIQFTAGSNTMVIDGTAVPMDNGVVAEITNDRMFVPFRALGQALGVPVTWDADTRTAIYNQK